MNRVYNSFSLRLTLYSAESQPFCVVSRYGGGFASFNRDKPKRCWAA